MLLSFDTSSRWCSVAFFEKGELLYEQTLQIERSHAEKLMVMIDQGIALMGKNQKDLEAIAIGMGPGSYTGLRIGASTAKGLAYALDIPVYGVSSLKAQALVVREHIAASTIITTVDARRKEIYYSIYNPKLEELEPPAPLILEPKSFERYYHGVNVVITGDGAEKTLSIINQNKFNLYKLQNITSSSIGKIALMNPIPLDTAYFEPEYIKPFYHEPK